MLAAGRQMVLPRFLVPSLWAAPTTGERNLTGYTLLAT